MISMLISILIALLILALIYWVLTLLPVPPNIRVVIIVILALIVLLYFLQGAHVVRG